MGSDINVIQCQEEKKRRSEMVSIFHGHPVFMGVKVKQDKLLYIVCKGNCAPLPSFFLLPEVLDSLLFSASVLQTR